MVDIHTHILPAVDDGSKSMEMSLQMCEMALADGITHIVASPHCNYEYEYNREEHSGRLRELRTSFRGKLEFSLGCDFHMSYENVQDALGKPQKYTIGSGPYLLVEFSDYSIPPSMDHALSELIDLRLVPVITHPERNPILQQHPARIIEWIELGCIAQVTANSLTGFWGSTAKNAAKWLLERHAVHVIASDAHDPRRRKPILSEGRDAAAAIVGGEVADLLVDANPEAIVSGKPLPYHP